MSLAVPASPVIGGLEQQLRTQPATVQFCTRCVVSNQRPRIVLDAEGVCSACRFSHKKYHSIDWATREQELMRGFAGMPKLEDRSRTVFNLLFCAIAGPTCRNLRQTASIGLVSRKELSGDDVVGFGCRVATVGTREVLPPNPGHRRSM